MRVPGRYSWTDLKKGLREPSLFLDELRTYYRVATLRLLERYFERRYGPGIDVVERDWDTLVILDALRYDAFEAVNDLDGESRSVVSQASNSLNFLRANFEGRDLNDTVYVTANGWIEKLDRDPFFATRKTYGDFERRYEHYAPENVFDLALETFERYPDKRYVVHFMQPHNPYLGPKAERLRDSLRREAGLRFEAIRETLDEENDVEGGEKPIKSLRVAAQQGYISDDELREVYVENLEVVLEYVHDLCERFDGKTVITADHGELLGERPSPFNRKRYGHPGDVATLPLRQVPWFEVSHRSRRDVRAEAPIESDSVTDEEVEASLRALGYHR